MRLILKLRKVFGLLDYNYNHKTSSMIYNNLVGTNYDNLHNSNKVGKYTFHIDINDSTLGKKTSDSIGLIISSSDEGLIETLYEKLHIGKAINIGKAHFVIDRSVVSDYQRTDTTILVETITPINVNYKGDGDKYEQYLHPTDTKYIEQLKKNILHKVGGDYTMDDVDILIPSDQKFKSRLIDIKGVKIKGYIFKFVVKAPSAVLKESVLNGFGSRNSQGFGFVNIIRGA